MSLLPLTWSKGVVLLRVQQVLRAQLATKLGAIRTAYAADALLATIQPPDVDTDQIVVAPLATQDRQRQTYPLIRIQGVDGAGVDRQANGIGIATWSVNVHVVVTAQATDDYDAQTVMTTQAHAYLDAVAQALDAQPGGLTCNDYGVYAWDETGRDVAALSVAESGAVTEMLGTLSITLQQYTPR